MENGNREHSPAREPRGRTARQHGRGIVGKVAFVLLTLLLVGICTGTMIGIIFMQYVRTTITPVVQVNADDYTMSLSSVIYYHDDAVTENDGWVEYQNIYGVENRIWADYEEMPDALWQAAVAIEDHRFFEHKGVDWRRTIGATANMFIGMRDTYGGSTITQQMLKNMTGDNKGTVNRKVREIFRALEFEKNYTKQEILELYLNFIFLGKSCYGVQTAANYYFGKDVSELSAAECACLIAITNNPYQYGPMSSLVITREDGTKVTARELNKERQEMILLRMAGGNEEVGYTGLDYLTMEEAEAACKEVLHFTDGTTSAEEVVAAASGGVQINDWFVEQVLTDVSADLAAKEDISEEAARLRIYNGGYKIYTTLDPKIQDIAESVYENRSNLDVTSRRGQKLQSGITIVDPYTGNIVATVGNVGPKEGNRVWNYATSTRQVGSSIKPLTVYAPALENNVVTMASTFDNYPVRLLNDKPWPKNSPAGYSGWTTLGDGLRSSINTVAVQVEERLGASASYAFATEKLGLNLVPDDMNSAALGLGGLTYGLNTVEMAAAFATFANGGTYHAPRTYLRVEDAGGNTILENEGEEHVAMKDSTAYFMNEMLKSVVTGGTGGSARFSGMTIAGKTGTTSENYDRYFVGYTPYYVAAVWTGYAQPEKISYSGNPAITMWKKVMQQVHADLPNKDFAVKTSGLETVEVCADSGLLPTEACQADVRGTSRVRQVKVVAGTAPTEHCTLHAMRPYCTEGQCLAGEFCPESSVVEKGYLDYVREDYGPSVTAADDPYLIVNAEKALETAGGCSVHSMGSGVWDPSDPNYNPEWQDPSSDPSGGFGDENMDLPSQGGQTGKPEEPAEPSEPVTPPETSGDAGAGGTGDWFNDLWSGSQQN